MKSSNDFLEFMYDKRILSVNYVKQEILAISKHEEIKYLLSLKDKKIYFILQGKMEISKEFAGFGSEEFSDETIYSLEQLKKGIYPTAKVTIISMRDNQIELHKHQSNEEWQQYFVIENDIVMIYNNVYDFNHKKNGTKIQFSLPVKKEEKELQISK